MAYINQEMKSKIAPAIKAIAKKYGLKTSLAVRDNRALVLTIQSGSIDFFKEHNADITANYIAVNHYSIEDNFNNEAKDALIEFRNALNSGNWNNTKIEVDYFDVGWYVDIKVGKWNKPYLLV